MGARVPPLPRGCGSWIIVERATGRAVRELYQAANVARINGARYVAVTASAYLASINGQGGAALDLNPEASA